MRSKRVGLRSPNALVWTKGEKLQRARRPGVIQNPTRPGQECKCLRIFAARLYADKGLINAEHTVGDGSGLAALTCDESPVTGRAPLSTLLGSPADTASCGRLPGFERRPTVFSKSQAEASDYQQDAAGTNKSSEQNLLTFIVKVTESLCDPTG